MSTEITAAAVKELRDRTSAGMMECKKALVLAGGDMELAIEELRKQGLTKAGKKAANIAADGVIHIEQNGKQVAIAEVNCQTDFAAREGNFLNYVKAVTETALNAHETDVEKIAALPMYGSTGKTTDEVKVELIAKIGEKVELRRVALSNPEAATVGVYKHGHRIGVMVELDVDNNELARDIAMHIAASKPIVISPENVSADLIAKEKEIYKAQSETSGKPANIIEKMVEGRLNKYLAEVSLTGQPFVKDPDTTVGALLNKHKAKVLSFHRFEVGEGIEKITEDFKESVMSQIQGG